jgi:hypothetical protein
MGGLCAARAHPMLPVINVNTIAKSHPRLYCG